jgi:hypothetical protein
MAGTQVDIATRFTGDEADLINAIEKVNQKLAKQAKTLRRSRRDWRQFTQNAIFGVEDVASTVGTGGLSGAVRAASNNVTMMLMAVGGPWLTAFGVAAAAALQLALALDLFGEKADETAEKLKEVGEAYADALQKGMKSQEQIHKFNKTIKEGTIEQRQAAIKSLEEQIEAEKSVLSYLQQNLDLRKQSRDAALEEAKARLAEAEATLQTGARGKKKKQLHEEAAQARKDIAAQEQARIDAAKKEMADLEAVIKKKEEQARWAKGKAKDDKANLDLAEREKKRQEELSTLIKKTGEREEYKQKLAGKNKKEVGEEVKAQEAKLKIIQKQIEILASAPQASRKEEDEQDLLSKREDAENRIAIAIVAQAMAAEEQKKHIKEINSELNASIKGSKEFAKAFQNVVKKEGKAISPADLDMSAPKPRGYSNPARRGLGSGQSPIDQFMKGKEGGDGAYFEGIFGSMDTPIDKFMAGRKTPEVGKGIDEFVKNRNAEESKRPAPAIEKYFEQKEANEEAKFKEFNKEAKETAKNTKASNELLSSIADSLNNGTRIDVVMGGILS